MRLLVIGPESYETYDLPSAGTVTIGRSESSDVRIDDAQASRSHARLVIGDTISIEDLGSINGTRVRDRPIGRGERVAIQPGETIAIGSSVVIVHIRNRRPAEPAPSDSPTFTEASLLDSALPHRSDAMQTIMRLAERAAAGTINVLILGETGVGKDVMAGAIHRLSPRGAAPYICLNCAAISESLLESELFGHEKGAFTGALLTKPGLIETAAGGTLFLDEVGELPLATQAKLLRVLETREVTRLGSVRPRKIDFRFVAATNRDLESDVERGKFRRDLYFRLNGISIRIPPLRERRGEIPALADTFLREACDELQRPLLKLSAAALASLGRKSWPGNIRELKNIIERAVLLCTGPEIGLEHLPDERTSRPVEAANDRTGPYAPRVAAIRSVVRVVDGRDGRAANGSKPISSQGASDDDFDTDAGAGKPDAGGERGLGRAGASRLDAPASGLSVSQERDRQRIIDALRECAGNQSRAAKLLGIPRRTFVARLDRYRIPRPKKGLGDGDARSDDGGSDS